jgi:hypothetical protein
MFGPRCLSIVDFSPGVPVCGPPPSLGRHPVFRSIRRKTEVFNMNTNTQALLVLPEQVLNIKVAFQKKWYIELIEQQWRNEITKAILEAKRRRP